MPLLVEFLGQVRKFVKAQDANELRKWLQVEPNAPQIYRDLAAEVRSNHARGTRSLESAIERQLPEEDNVPEGQATPWPGFVTFMIDYIVFWRDVDFEDLLRAHTLLSGLVK